MSKRSKDRNQELVLFLLPMCNRDDRTACCRVPKPATSLLLVCIVVNYFILFFFTAVTCSMKITWYILVLLVFLLGIVFIIHKILEDHRRVWRQQSKY